MIHAVLEGVGQLLDAAAAPSMRWRILNCFGHDAVVAVAVIFVVRHSKTVAQFVSNRRSDNRDYFVVISCNATRALNGTNRASQSLTDNTIGKFLTRQQLRVVVRVRLHQLILPVIQEHV